jgi:hypothetical protein
MAAWAGLLAERIHAVDEECRVTLGQGDVVRGRGVRLAALAEHVDAVGLVLRPQRLALPGQPLAPGRAVFLAELAEALAGVTTPLMVELGIASGEMEDAPGADGSFADRVTAPPDDARRAADEMLQRLIGSGVAGLHAGGWCDWGKRLIDTPPVDRRRWWSRLGIVDSTGVSKPIAEAWEAVAGRDHAVGSSSPYPVTIDVESYYANLPDSLLDLHASWEGDRGSAPAILD